MPATLDANTIAAIDCLRKEYKATVPDKLIALLPKGISVEIDKRSDTGYRPGDNVIICNPGTSLITVAERQMVMAHELAHAIHTQHNIVTDTHIDRHFLKLIRRLRKDFNHRAADVLWSITEAFYRPDLTIELSYKLTVLDDIVGSMTAGEDVDSHAYPHKFTYYRNGNGAEKELFAHAVALNYLNLLRESAIHSDMYWLAHALKGCGLQIIQGVIPPRIA